MKKMTASIFIAFLFLNLSTAFAQKPTDDIALYELCLNTLKFSEISDKASSFKATGALIEEDKKQQMVTIIPQENEEEVVIEAYFEGEMIASRAFVIKKPKKNIEVSMDGDLVDIQQGIALNGYLQGKIKITVDADADFKTIYPAEARYLTKGVTVILARGNKAIASFNSCNLTGDLSPLLSKARAGDRLVVEVKDIIRVNADNQVIPNGNAIITIPITE